jgi:hypothetical protein
VTLTGRKTKRKTRAKSVTATKQVPAAVRNAILIYFCVMTVMSIARLGVMNVKIKKNTMNETNNENERANNICKIY